MEWQAWVERCAGILAGNQISSQGYRYTRPAPHVYEYQWLWDSCFHAIAYRWYDPDMAQAELYSLVAGQVNTGPDAGMIPHMIYWQGDGTALWGQARHSLITQPPLIATAAMLVHQLHPDAAFLRALYAPLCAYHAWFDRRRDPDADHLVTIIHPWESGWDASPRWDEPMGLRQPDDDTSRQARHALAARLQQAECDAGALAAAGSFAVEPMDFNAIRAADLEALARMAEALGEDARPHWHKARAIQQAAARFAHADGFYDLCGTEEKALRVRSAAPFVLLFGGCLGAAAASELVQALASDAWWPRCPVPTTPTDDAAFDPAHYWRGNVWPSVNWLVYQGLRRYGYHQQASSLAQRFASLVESSGFHEYFNPLTGEGYGPAQQSWTTLVLDMVATERRS
jgi:glycogen debranching enzyme